MAIFRYTPDGDIQLATAIDVNVAGAHGGPQPYSKFYNGQYSAFVGSDVDFSQLPSAIFGLSVGLGFIKFVKLNGSDAISSIANGVYFDVTGATAPATLGGGSRADRLVGGLGPDTLIGNAGNDILIGGAGADTAVYKGARSAYAVTLAGSGFVVQDLRSGSPDGQDTLAGIEKLIFRDGSITVAHDANGFEIVSFDAADRRDFSRLTKADGSVIVTDFDQANAFGWSSSVYDYDAQGRIDTHDLLKDDGTRLFTDYDQAGAFFWTKSIYGYDAQGRVTSQLLFNDAGTRSTTLFDQADAGPWLRTIETYDAQDRLDTYLLLNDNGSYRVTDFDQADQSDRYSITYDYDAQGNITKTTIQYDDGTGLIV